MPMVHPNSLANLRQPFTSENRPRGGRQQGLREEISRKFLKALAKDFDQFGEDALTLARENDPLGYCRMIASLLPKELNLDLNQTSALDDLSMEQLQQLASGLEQLVALVGSGAKPAASEILAAKPASVH